MNLPALSAAEGFQTSALSTAGLVVLALGAVLAARRWWPPSASEGLLVGFLSALLLLSSTGPEAWHERTLLAAALASLAAVWFVAWAWLDKRNLTAQPPLGARAAVRSRVAGHLASVAGVTAAGLILTGFEGGSAARGDWAIAGLLVVTSLGYWLTTRSSWCGCGVLASAALLALMIVSGTRAGQAARNLVWLSVTVSAAALLYVLAAAIRDWRVRVRHWHTAPERLLEPPPNYRRSLGAILVASWVASGLALLAFDHIDTALALGCAGFATLITGHRWRSNAVGALGLLLLGLAEASAIIARVPASPAAPLLACAAVTVHLAWLADFWRQQLHQGRPWTTAGRLIPSAGRISAAAALAQIGGVIIWANAVSSPAQLDWMLFTSLVLLAGSSWLLQAGPHYANPPFAAALCLAILAVLAWRVTVLWLAPEAHLAPFLLFAAVLLLLARGFTRDTARREALECYGLGLLPSAAIVTLFILPAGSGTVLAAIVLVAAILGLQRGTARPIGPANACPAAGWD